MMRIGSKQRIESLMQLSTLSSITEAMVAAFELKVFDSLSVRNKTFAEISKDAGCHEESLTRLLELLASLKVIKKSGRFCKHYKHLEKYLRSDSADYIGDYFLLHQSTRQNWSRLKETVKTGAKASADSRNEEEIRFFQRGMKAKNVFHAAKVVEMMELEGKEKLLELCAGAGSFTCNLLKQNPNLLITALDLPQTIPVTERMVNEALLNEADRENLLKRLSFAGANVFDHPFEPQAFDVVFLADAMHIWGEEKNLLLFRKVFETLTKGGTFYIYDFFINEKGTAPLTSLIFHNHMNLMTEAGKVYRGTETKNLLTQAGFSSIRIQRTDKSDHILVSAKKVR